jgi:quercetin dioxygenase-like cupin family protein
VRAFGADFKLQARAGRASVLMAVAARGGGTLADAVKRAQQKPKKTPATRRLQGDDFKISQKVTWGNGAYHARIAFGTDIPSHPTVGLSLTLLQATGSGSVPENVHEKEWEHIAILRGSGDMLLGDAKYPVRPGAVFHVPRGVVHGWQGGGEELVAVLLFSPPGPEQRFIQLASPK